MDCNTDQTEGLTWDEVEQCEVNCNDDYKEDDHRIQADKYEFVTKSTSSVIFFRRGTWRN